jgi:polysaccharide pyruvyl transferase WcaK-like protein
VLRLIADSTASLGVRGTYSAEVLNELGIKNVRIIGCPTAFRANNPNLAIRLPALDQVKTVGVTMRREVSRDYAQDIQRYLTFHRDLVKTMAGRFDVTLMAQGEVEEKKLALGTPEQKEEAIAALRENGWANEWFLDEEMERLYRSRMFYSDVVAEYQQLVRGLDLVLGYRLHGNLMALANGTPSIYFTYDSRTVEFAETFKIPSFDVFSGQEFRLEEYWEQARFDRFNANYTQVYGAMRDFLVENRVDNKMLGQAAAAAEPERKVA